MVLAMSSFSSLDGPALLESAIQREKLCNAELERQLGIEKTGLVSRWLSGERTPGLALAIKLRDRLGIPVDSWVRQTTETAEPARTETAVA